MTTTPRRRGRPPGSTTKPADLSAMPTGLSPRGRALWTDLTDGRELDGAQRVMVAEFCRLADRLERLDGMLRGRSGEWLKIAEREEFEDEVTITVVLDDALSESRQQQLAMRQIANSLGVKPLPDRKRKGGGALDELAQRRRNDRKTTAADIQRADSGDRGD